MYSSVYLRAINYRILFFIATFAIPSCCFLCRDVVLSLGNTPHHITSHHTTSEKICEELKHKKRKQNEINNIEVETCKIFSEKLWMVESTWCVKKCFLCVRVSTIGPKHQNKILNMQATCVPVCVRIESNFYLICLMSFILSWNYDIDDHIKSTKNEKFPRNLYKFIGKIKKCHINCGFDFSSFPHF